MKFIKKHKYKLLSFALTLISVFTLFLGITKTYAYETNQFTYSAIDTSNYSFTTINGINGVVWDLTNTPNVNTFNITHDSSGTGKFDMNSQFLINFYFIDLNNEFILLSNNSNHQYYLRDNVGTSISTFRIRNTNHSGYMVSICTPLVSSTNVSQNTQVVKIATSVSYTDKKMFITNIDIVAPYDIGLEQYYDTYYSNIEANYNQLQQDYDSLESQYESLQDDYNESVSDYNYLEVHYNTLLDDYVELNGDYQSLQQQYNSLHTNYIDLQQQFNTLQNDYRTLQNNYNNLLNSYNSLSTDFINLSGEIDSLELQIQQKNAELQALESQLQVIQSSRDSMIQGGLYNALNGTTARFYNTTYTDLNTLNNSTPLITETISMDSYAWKSSSIPTIESAVFNGSYNDTNLVARSIVRLTLNAPTKFVNLTFSRVDKNQNRYIYLIFNDNTNASLTILDSGEYDTQNITWDNNDNKLVSEIIFDVEPNYDMVSNINPSDVAQIYENAYGKGYFDGSVDNYQEIISLNNTINTYQTQLTNMQLTINSLNEQLSSVSNDYGINNMLWTIASTPFESFKQIWNVELFGVNIANAITGFLTSIIVLYVIKKFFL